MPLSMSCAYTGVASEKQPPERPAAEPFKKQGSCKKSPHDQVGANFNSIIRNSTRGSKSVNSGTEFLSPQLSGKCPGKNEDLCKIFFLIWAASESLPHASDSSAIAAL